MVVPSYRDDLPQQLRRLGQGADHVRLYIPSIRQQRQRKCVLGESLINHGPVYNSSSSRRHYSCQVGSGFTKIDASVNNASRQNVRGKAMENQGSLSIVKKEILNESKILLPLLIKSVEKGI